MLLDIVDVAHEPCHNVARGCDRQTSLSAVDSARVDEATVIPVGTRHVDSCPYSGLSDYLGGMYLSAGWRSRASVGQS